MKTTNEQSSGVTYIAIDNNYAGQRIDNYLVTHLKGVPRSHIYRLLRKGEVRVNKKRIKPEYRLQEGDQLRLPPIRMSTNATENRTPPSRLLQVINQTIIFEDAGLIVINKPAGIAVHGGSGVNFGVIELLRQARPELKNLELVHRLDRDTSGCLMIAKKRSMLHELHELIRENKVEKIYSLLVKGKWRDKLRRVDLPLQKNQLASGERMVRVSEEGKASVTIFTRLQVGEQSSLLQAKLETGRTHQIRVHSAYLGHPLAGDEKYGDKDFNKQMRTRGLKRLFLHAASLQFVLPSTGQIYHFMAPMPEELELVLNNL